MSANSAIYNPSQTTSAATGDGFSCPRLTTTGRLAITFTTADKGMMVYDTTLNNLFIWNGTAWESVPASGDSTNEQVIFNDNGILAGDAGLTYNKAIQRLNVGPGIQIWRGQLQDAFSTAVGNTALAATLAGATGNTAIGYRSMYRSTTANNCVSVGANALSGLALTGNNNVAVGVSSLATTANGYSNVGVGAFSLTSNIANFENTAVGTESLKNVAGNGNTAIGNQAGMGLGVTIGCVAVGSAALYAATGVNTGFYNIAVGYTAMQSSNAISGADNIGIGRDTFRNLSSGIENIAIGRVALNANATGNYNIAIGSTALNACVVGATIGIGVEALLRLQNGGNNTAVGTSALRELVSNSNNTALGYYAGRAVTGADVTAIGANALALATTGFNNTAVGSNAMGFAVTTGAYNTAIGAGAGSNLTSGPSNVFIGNDCASTTTTGGQNICIGVGTRTSTNTISNELCIGSSSGFVATNGAAATYFATATTGAVVLGAAQGFIRINLNGTLVKIPVYGN